MTKPLDTNLLLHASHIAICIYGSLVTCRFWIVKLSELEWISLHYIIWSHGYSFVVWDPFDYSERGSIRGLHLF